jgi:hypothetical protein
MRTSGKGGMDAVLFIAPGLIFLGILMYLQGGPSEVLTVLDRLVLRAANAVSGWVAAVLS